MPTGVLVSGILATVLSIALFLFHLLMRRRYVRLLPGIFRTSVDSLLRGMMNIKPAVPDKIPAIDAAFRNVSYEPLQRRWQLCYRDYKEVTGSESFLDVDEFFAMAPLLEESLERRNAGEAPKWLVWAGVFAAGIVLTLGFLLSGGAQFNPFIVIGMAMGTMALSVAFSLEFRYEDARVFESCMEDYIDLMARLKECLPPIGRNSLIQTLYRLQTSQKEQLRQQTEQMRAALTTFAVETLSEQMGSRFQQSIERYLQPPIQKMADVQTTVLNRLQHDQQHRLEQLFTLFTKETGEQMQKQLGGMTEQVNRAAVGMREIVTALHTVAKDAETSLIHNRETTAANQTLLKTLNETHTQLTERFSEATILLDDIMTSSKSLAETTTNANLATIELAEQAGALQKETGERFELLRTTLEERLTASTDAAVAMQEKLSEHAEKIQGSLGTHSQDIRSSLGEYAGTVRSSLGDYAGTVRASLGEYTEGLRASLDAWSLDMAERLASQTEAGVLQRAQEAQGLLTALQETVTAMQEQTAVQLKAAQEYSQETSRRFGEEATALFDRYEKQNEAVAQELQLQGRTNANLLSMTHKTLADSAAVQAKAFEAQSLRAADAFEQQSTRLVEAWNKNAEGFYESLHDEARSLLQVLPNQMKEAFDAFTSAMGETMRATLTDSVEIVDKLGERIQQLHSEFELYFSRTEGNTETQIADMRFAMEGAIGKFSELSSESLTQMRDGNQEAMEAFSNQTRQLMEAVDEQTRTLSLYVKDMGIDMADLNKGLKESVSQFTTHLHSGVTDTFQEFDTGMAEIVRRMTELGVRIEEAVEKLPESIGRLGNGGK